MKQVLCAFVAFAVLAGCSAPADPTSIIAMHPKSEVVPMLKEARKGGKAVTLLHFSDLHGYAPNLARIVEFAEYYDAYVDDAIHAGDGVICYMDNPNEWNNVPGAERVMNVVGNHDCWKGHKVWAETDMPYDATKEDAYQVVMVGEDSEHPFIANWDVTQPAGVNDLESVDYCACYYYKDYPAAEVRLIALDCMHFDAAQEAWFKYVLSEACAMEYAVVGVTHYPAESGVEPVGEWDEIPSDYSDAIQFERMPDEAFAAVDEFKAAGGEFVCWLSGHEHKDFFGYVRGHDKQLQVIIGKAGDKDAYVEEARELGTVDQDEFNLISVNSGKGVLTIDRIGCSVDAKGRSMKQLRYDYRLGKLLD